MMRSVDVSSQLPGIDPQLLARRAQRCHDAEKLTYCVTPDKQTVVTTYHRFDE
jgi:hypothetical protein